MKKERVKTLRKEYYNYVAWRFPSFSASGNIAGMRRIYPAGALMVRAHGFIYNVSSEPDIYYNMAY